jgi:hypothetical protein
VGPGGNPWEQRDSLGFGQAFIEGVKAFIFNPGAAFDQTRRTGDFAGPLIFAVLLGWIGAIFGQLWNLVMQGSMMSMMPAEFQDQMGLYMMGGGGSLLMTMVLAPIFCVIGLFIGTAIMHVCLMVVGGLSASQSGFEGTFRVLSYSSVAQLANVIPLLGGLVGLVWTIVLFVMGSVRLHSTTQGKALAAALIPVILCCVCIGAAMVLGFAGMASMFANQ